jgi:GDSL-like lipase/acylhydrolase family protein
MKHSSIALALGSLLGASACDSNVSPETIPGPPGHEREPSPVPSPPKDDAPPSGGAPGFAGVARASLEDLPTVPAIDPAMKDRLIAIHRVGHGFDARVMKVGDSITDNGSFLVPLGTPSLVLEPAADLAGVASLFAQPIEGTTDNSLTRPSLSALRGWSTADLLRTDYEGAWMQLLLSVPNPYRPPGNLWAQFCGTMTPIDCEATYLVPSWAVVMLGTNDVGYGVAVETMKDNLRKILGRLIELGIVPIVSTIPEILNAGRAIGAVRPTNEAIADLAAELQVPLVNYWRASQSLPGNGLSADQVHPSCPAMATNPQASCLDENTGAGNLTYPYVTTWGFNARNDLTLKALKKVIGIVVYGAAAD